jgi:hypothetical protein
MTDQRPLGARASAAQGTHSTERLMPYMQTEPRTIIAVRPEAALAARPRLFAALEAAFPVTFRAWARDSTQAEALIVLAADPGLPSDDELARLRVPVLVVSDGTAVEGPPEDVRLSNEDGVDRRLRGVALTERLAGSPLAPAADGDASLAAAPSGPAWTRSRSPVPVHRVRSAMPELGPDHVLSAFFWGRTLAAVALIHFLRERTQRAGWRAPPLRAAFVFDDPNLRWRSYGFIDYRRLAEHADAHGYHAAMAMIPLDAGRPHGPTVSLFARRRDRLSLVYHGNDHVKRELLRPREPGSALAMAAQAVRRVQRFERRWGLPVDRVMMPPHGMCSETVSRALAAVGFDALCAIHPIPWTGRAPGSALLAGWQPAEFVGGCAVIPRISLHCSPGEIALRAFLDHPIVLYGHHEDLAHGLEPLAEAAARVNGLGEVRWSALGELARTNHALRVSGDRVAVRPYARRIGFARPAGARSLSVEEPRQAHGELELSGWSLASGEVRPFGTDAPLTGGDRVEVRLHGEGDIDPNAVVAPAWRPWPRLRRAGTEMRDRALPLRPARAR